MTTYLHHIIFDVDVGLGYGVNVALELKLLDRFFGVHAGFCVFLTFTFEPLPDKTPQHLPTVVTESGCLVGVDVEGMGSDLEVFNCGLS